MADIYNGMWVNPLSTSSFASVMRDYVRDMSRKEAYEAYEKKSTNRSSVTRNAMANAEAQKAEFAKAAAERKAAAAKAEAQQKASREASIKTARDNTEKSINMLTPWRDAGVDALGQITEKVAAGPGDFEASPGYQFRLNEGQKALERSASARGNVLGGATQKAITRYAQDYATQDYDNFLRRYYDTFDPLQKLSSEGMSAAGRMGDYQMTGSAQEINARTGGTNQMVQAGQYGADAVASGMESGANIMAATAAAEAEREYAYDAWKSGEDF